MVEAKPLAMPEASFPFGATPEQMEQNRLEHEWKTVIEQLVGVMDDGNYRQRLMSLMQLTGNKNMLDGIMEMFFRIDFLMQSQDLILEEKVRMQNLLRQQMRLSGVDPVEDDLQRLLSCVQMREYYKERAFSRLADAYASKKEAPEVRQNIQGMSLHEPVQRRSSRTSTVPQRMNLGHEAKKSRKKKQRDKAEDDDEEVSDGSGSDGNDEDSDSQSQIVFMDNAVNFVQNTRQVDRQIREYV